MRTTFFTGAGVSKAIGYPLTSELLPRVLKGIKEKTLFNTGDEPEHAAEDRENLGKYLDLLLPGLEDTEVKNLPLITDLFSLVEHAIAADEALPIGDEERTRHCRQLLKRSITDVLLAEWLIEYDRNDPLEKVLEGMVDWYGSVKAGIGLVTTNYDFGFEGRLYEGLEFKRLPDKLDLGTDWRDCMEYVQQTRPKNPSLRVFKLHGSLDTLRCRVCGNIYFNHEGDIAWQAFRKKIDKNNTCVCSKHIKLDLHIVAPSLVREMKDANLLSVWRSAFEWMRTSEHWVLAGYSLPPEDLAVRSLLLRAYHAAEKKPKITVVQRGEDAAPRYRMLFPKCEYIGGEMKEFLEKYA